MDQVNHEIEAVVPAKGGRVTKNWNAIEGLTLINKAKALKIDDTTLSNDSRWEDLGNSVAESLNTAARSVSSNIEHLKAMVKLVRSMSSAYSMANAENQNAVKCPAVLATPADETMTEAYNRGNL